MKLFSYDSQFSQAILKLCYSCYLNLLWFLCSIPVFTAGAATTALYDVTLRISRGEDPSLTSRFFRAFRENFRQSTILWLILLALGILLSLDGYILYNLYKTTTGVFSVVCTLGLAVVIAAAILYCIVLLYLFPLIASVRNRSWPMLRNALLIGIRYLFCTIVVFAIHFAMFFVVVAFFLLACFVYLLASGIHNALTQKSPVVYLAYLNISVGDDMDGYLSDGFISDLGRNPEKEEVYRYFNLYVSDNPSAENHEYAYTSGLKLLAAINAKQLDLVLMNKEAYDLCSANGYLLDLAHVSSFDNLPTDIQALITENLVIQEDNSIEFSLGETDSYTAVTQTVANAWNVSSLPQFQQAGFSGDVYLGIIANTPRLEMAPPA